ncbi:MAG: type II secretion system protein [Halobacteriaceae archaeon]
MSFVLRALAALSPVEPSLDGEFERAVAFADIDANAETVANAALGAVSVALVLAGMIALSPLRGGVLVAGATMAVGATIAVALYECPGWVATARRSRAAGDVPELIGLAALRARVAPTPEEAAAFAGEHAGEPLAASLREHVRRAQGTPRAGWEGFATAWGDWDPSLRRAVSLLTAAVDADAGDRERLLDRSLDVVLTGTRERMSAFAASIRGPTSAIYAFGVVLPLALVATLPAARAAGLPISMTVVVAMFDVALPCLLLGAAAWLVARRPAAFPPAPVPRSHPDVPDRRAVAVTCALLGGVLAWVGVGRIAPAWTRLVATPGVALGAALVCWYDPVRRVRERVSAVETGLADALSFVGQRLQHGESLERAVAAAGDDLSGPVADVFADAARTQTHLRVGVRASFLGEQGALADVPSPRARASAALLALAAREGGDGGRILVEMAEYVDDLTAVERDARRNLASVTGTLRSTAYCFAPLIGGVTVALAGRLGRTGASLDRASAPLPTDALGLAVGVYVVALAALLVSLAAVLDRGFDRALVGFHVGVAVAVASVLYPLSVAGASLLV